MNTKTKVMITALVVTSTFFLSEIGRANDDFGTKVEKLLDAQSQELFGIQKPLSLSASATSGAYRTESQSASEQVLLAEGLKAEYVTRNAGNATDMMVLWPKGKPTHLITCVEGSRQDLGLGKFNPSVQRINLQTGDVETILRGMTACDGIRTTAWGTILVTEETNTGKAYEIADPLATTENTVVDRTTGEITGNTAANIVIRNALPTMAWEGIGVHDSGVLYAGDELRPGTATPDRDGGALFKFIPDVPWNGQMGIENSPFASGLLYALQVTCSEGKQQFGQGCEIGKATWVGPIDPLNARADAVEKQATGYYRPEDLEFDPVFVAPAGFESAVRFCWTNTGNEEAGNFAEVICAVDLEPAMAIVSEGQNRLVEVNRFIEGDRDFNSFDNLAFQPKTGNLYVIEDHENGDIFACLSDGADRDIKSDGCIKVMSVKDSSAEPTGFLFSDDGETAYVSIQHSDDVNMPHFDDYPTDDVLKITGFKISKIKKVGSSENDGNDSGEKDSDYH